MSPVDPIKPNMHQDSPNSCDNGGFCDDYMDSFQATPFFSNIFKTLYDDVGLKVHKSDKNVVIERRNSLLSYSHHVADSLYSDRESCSSAPCITTSTTPSPDTTEAGRGRISKTKLARKFTIMPLDTGYTSDLRSRSPMVRGSIHTPESSTSVLQDLLTKPETNTLPLSTNVASSFLLQRRSTSLENGKTSPSQTTLDSPMSNTSLSYSPLTIPNDIAPFDIQPQSITASTTPMEKNNSHHNILLRQTDNPTLGILPGTGQPISHETKNNIHPCTICGKQFQRPSTLETHMNIHSGDQPYECPFLNCEKLFNAKSNMLRHLKMHFKLGKGKYLLPNGEISSTKPTAKQLTCFINTENNKR